MTSWLISTQRYTKAMISWAMKCNETYHIGRIVSKESYGENGMNEDCPNSACKLYWGVYFRNSYN